MIEGENKMTNEIKIMALKQRKALLESRGPHNEKIIAKINRKIRLFES